MDDQYLDELESIVSHLREALLLAMPAVKKEKRIPRTTNWVCPHCNGFGYLEEDVKHKSSCPLEKIRYALSISSPPLSARRG